MVSTASRSSGDSVRVLVPTLVMAVACSMTAPVLSGRYSLVSFSDQPLPAVITASATTNSQSALEVWGWELTLDEGGAYTSWAVFRRTTDGLAKMDTVASSGRFYLEANRVEVRSSTGEVRTFIISDEADKLTSAPGPGDVIHGVARLDVLVFRKGQLGTR